MQDIKQKVKEQIANESFFQEMALNFYLDKSGKAAAFASELLSKINLIYEDYVADNFRNRDDYQKRIIGLQQDLHDKHFSLKQPEGFEFRKSCLEMLNGKDKFNLSQYWIDVYKLHLENHLQGKVDNGKLHIKSLKDLLPKTDTQ